MCSGLTIPACCVSVHVNPLVVDFSAWVRTSHYWWCLHGSTCGWWLPSVCPWHSTSSSSTSMSCRWVMLACVWMSVWPVVSSVHPWHTTSSSWTSVSCQWAGLACVWMSVSFIMPVVSSVHPWHTTSSSWNYILMSCHWVKLACIWMSVSFIMPVVSSVCPWHSTSSSSMLMPCQWV